ncbi:hypothetical protein DCAR_0205874 [Daucus carota subsp. sativus]|nr:hypothetical protein DCAR_0205874 [Daucus carota subsp. sativus]
MTPVEMFVRLKIDLIVRINIPIPRVPVSEILLGSIQRQTTNQTQHHLLSVKYVSVDAISGRKVCFPSLLKVHEDEPVFQAFKLMRQEGFSRLPVVESNGKRDKTVFNSARGAVKPSSLCAVSPSSNREKKNAILITMTPVEMFVRLKIDLIVRINIPIPRVPVSEILSIQRQTTNQTQHHLLSVKYVSVDAISGRKVCFPSLLKVHEDEPVFQAFKLMRQEGFGRLPVVESNGKRDKTVFNSARGAVKPSSLCAVSPSSNRERHNFTKEAPNKKALLNLMQDKVKEISPVQCVENTS